MIGDATSPDGWGRLRSMSVVSDPTPRRPEFERDPENFVIRKRLWAVEHPERFYEGAVDFAWPRAQLASGR